jgi:hypothetical protein
VKTPKYSTIDQMAPNEDSTRVAQANNPFWTWQLIYDYLKASPNDLSPGLDYTDFETLLGFFMAQKGKFADFLYVDPDDNFVGPALITATWLPNFSYVRGSIIIDSNGHAQKVTTAPFFPRSGATTPAWNSTGGTTSDGNLTWTDQGLAPVAGFPNPRATLQLITDGTTWYSPIQRNMGGVAYEDIHRFERSHLGCC